MDDALPLWSLLGVGYAMILTPTGRLLRRSTLEADRPGVFAAQFALSHACWLVTYPLAGWFGTWIGLPATILLHAALAALAIGTASRLWPLHDPEIIGHIHDLPSSHPHLPAAEMAKLNIIREDFHPECNYSIKPRLPPNS